MHFVKPAVFALVLLGSGFAAGVWYAQVSSEAVVTPQETSRQLAPAPVQATGTPPESVDRLAVLLQNKQWYQITEWLQAPTQVVTYAQGQAIIQAIQANMNKYDALAMRRMLNLYLTHQPDDSSALFLLSDLQLLEGMEETALQTLLGIMSGGFAQEQVERARREADRLIETITTALRNRRAFSELQQFWQHVSERYPSSDAYRYRWARSLLLAGQVDQAHRLLAEVGTTDVAQDSLDELARDIAEARQGPGFVQRNGQLVATVASSVEGLNQFELLVDTGANVTSLSRRALRQLNAIATGRNVRVRTAAGTVETEVFVVPEMYVQGRLVTNLRTLRLPNEMLAMDGLLGTDVLRRFKWMPVDSL